MQILSGLTDSFLFWSESFLHLNDADLLTMRYHRHNDSVIRHLQEGVVTWLYIIQSVRNFKCIVKMQLWGDWRAKNDSPIPHSTGNTK